MFLNILFYYILVDNFGQTGLSHDADQIFYLCMAFAAGSRLPLAFSHNGHYLRDDPRETGAAG
jgi:hypothetical protein